ncbi:MAG: TatA/E family twin arginine-targeting protein translocase [Oculatellaceae cyanobacterium Prado106]|jgi:sec-independent protein translocase protein TatA|nr:TatA/E family twin arginine-targeting protein translocase [Oculatellaceae cyanobacterium Prado106]
MNIFGIGLPEMALIMVLALLVFGPKKLPEIGRSMGKAIKGFQDASKEFETEFKKEADRIEKVVTEPMKATLEPPTPKALSESATDATIVEPTPEPQIESHESQVAAEPETANPVQQG